MNDNSANSLEAKLYEAIDQLATMTGIAGARSDEAGVIQSVGENAASAVTATDGALAPSSVILSGVTSLAPRDAAASARDEGSAASPLPGSGGGRQPGAASSSNPTVRAEGLRDAGLDARDNSAGSSGSNPGAPVPAAGVAGSTAEIIGAADDAGAVEAQNDIQPVVAGGEGPDTLTGAAVAEAVEMGSGSATPAPAPLDTVQDGSPSGPSSGGATQLANPDPTPGGNGLAPADPAPADLAGVTTPVFDTVSDVAGGLLDGGLLGPAPNQAGDTDLTVDVVSDLIGAPILADLDVGLDPVETLLGTDIDIDLDAVVELGSVTTPVVETVSDIAGGLLNGGLLGPASNQAGDTDLTLDVVSDLIGAPVIADLDVGLDPVETLLGTDIDIDLDVVADLGGVITPVVETVSDITGSLLDGGLLGPAPNQADDTDLTLDVVTDLIGAPILADLNGGLDPVENLLGTDIDIDLDAVVDLGGVNAPVVETVSDVAGGLLDGGLLGPAPNQTGDTDLTVDVVTDLIGAPILADLDVGLDPVETLLGTDIDIDLDAVADLGGVIGPVVETVSDVAGDLLDGGLLGPAPNQAGDTDLTVDAVADLIGAPVIADLDIGLDPVENLLGTDIDIDLDAVADLGGVIGPVVETVSDVAGGLLDGGLLGPAPNQAGDTDLTVDVVTDLIGAPILADLDAGLNPVENLLGTDIDIDLDAVVDLGSITTPVVETVSDITGSLLDGGLLGAAPNQAGDTDLTVDVVTDLIGTPILADLDVGLDPVENLLGTDIDIDLDAVVDLGGTLASIGGLGDNLNLSPLSDGADDDISLELALDVPGLDPLLDDLTAGFDIDVDAIEQLLDTDIDLDLDFGIDIGGFESVISGGGASPGGNMTLNELMTFDTGSTASVLGSTLDVTTATLATVTSSTTNVISSVTQSFTAKFGGGLFG